MPGGQYVRKPGIGDSNSNVGRYIYIGKKKSGRNQEELRSKFTVQRRDRARRFNRALALFAKRQTRWSIAFQSQPKRLK